LSLDLSRYWNFSRNLNGFLRDRLTAERALTTIKSRLEKRETSFLQMVQNTIFGNPHSPYLKLLKMCGCEYGDIQKMAVSDGIEGTLEKLKTEGIFISLEEFKGRKECRRGSQTFLFRERDFNNLTSGGNISVTSSGSRGKKTRSLYDLEFLTANISTYNVPLLNGLEATSLPIALWMPSMPGAGILNLLAYTKFGNPPVKWFSPLREPESKSSLKDRLATRYIRSMSYLAGYRWPHPEHVPYDNTIEIVRWIHEAIKRYGGCIVDSYVSAIQRICRTAEAKGIDLHGVRFIIGGEPLTDLKLNEIKKVTSQYCILYGISEAGFVGGGCFDPLYSDDVHIFEDTFGLISQRRIVPHAGIEVNAFLLTSFLLSAPKVLLNVEVGDHGSVDTRKCNCIFGELGFNKHIHHIRGFDKLSSEGTTFLAADMVRIIEDVLPVRFGGVSTDYQLIEEEDEKGNTRIYVIASPELGSIDENVLIQFILSELSKGSEAAKMMTIMWHRADTLKVKRIKPMITATGKLLPLHIKKANPLH